MKIFTVKIHSRLACIHVSTKLNNIFHSFASKPKVSTIYRLIYQSNLCRKKTIHTTSISISTQNNIYPYSIASPPSSSSHCFIYKTLLHRIRTSPRFPVRFPSMYSSVWASYIRKRKQLYITLLQKFSA